MAENSDNPITTAPSNTRPKISPYASSTLTLCFKNGSQLRAPEALIAKVTKLLSCRKPGLPKIIQLHEIDGDAGHVLVHYLYTGKYQSLEPDVSSPREKSAAEFTTSIRVYSIAQDFEIPELEDLAKAEIEHLGAFVPVTHLLDIVGSEHTVRLNDTWFHEYLKSVVEPLIADPLSFPSAGEPDSSEQSYSVAAALLKVMVGLCREKMTSIQPTSAITTESEQLPGPEPVEIKVPPPESDSQNNTVLEKKIKRKAKLEKRKREKEERRRAETEEKAGCEPINLEQGDSSSEYPGNRKSPTDFEHVTLPVEVGPWPAEEQRFDSSSSTFAKHSSSATLNPLGFPDSTRGLNPDQILHEMHDVPLITELQQYRLVDIEYFGLHIQDVRLKYSPEELRWKYQVWEMGSH